MKQSETLKSAYPTIGWDTDSWLPRAIEHLITGNNVLSDYELGQLCILERPVDLPLSHGVKHAYACTGHLLLPERNRASFLRMLTVWYQGVDTVKAGPFTVKWDDQLPDQRLQSGYEALCHRLAHLSLKKFPPTTLSSGQSSFQWLNYFPDQPALLSFVRENEKGEDLIFILNRSNESIKSLTMGVKKEGLYEVLLDSDSLLFIGGREEYLSPYSSKPEPANDCAHSIFIDMPPASALILQREA